MKCPFRIKETTVSEYKEACQYVKYRDFDTCYGDECPFFYKNDEDVDCCARCDGGPREEEL